MKSWLTNLECTNCGATYSAEELHTTCTACGKVLFARYDLEAVKRELKPDMLLQRPPTMWRWVELMPVRDQANIVTLGEGGTPLLPAKGIEAALGAKSVFVKSL